MSSNYDGISVIVPFLNEEKALPIFCETMEKYAAELSFSVELVFVNDGSTDSSVQFLSEYTFNHIDRAKLIDLSRNYGFHSAVRAGIMYASYDICTWFGADLQEPLEILPIAFEKLHNHNCEVVYFSKHTVGVSKINRLFSKIYSCLMQKYAIKTYSSEGTATVAFGKKIKENLNKNIESNSQVILQIMDMGYKYESVSLDYHARSVGESKWSLSKKIKAFIDSFVAFSYIPIRLVSLVGIVIFAIGFIIGILTIINKYTNPTAPVGYSTIACVLALGFGVTNISLGIIAEYLWRILDVARNRPVFIVSEIIQLNKKCMGETSDEQ